MFEKLLLVEGDFDKYFISELLRKTSNKIISEDAIKPFRERNEVSQKADEQGINALLKRLPVTIKATAPSHILGLIVDADINVAGRWQRIRQILTEAGYQYLPDTLSDGLIMPTNDVLPRFGLWIMPDNQEEGIIENFIRKLIHDQDKLQPEIDATLTTLKTKNLQLFTDVHRPKAFIKTWLAWQERPETSVGVAMSKKILMTDTELCLRFIDWLNRLFNSQ